MTLHWQFHECQFPMHELFVFNGDINVTSSHSWCLFAKNHSCVCVSKIGWGISMCESMIKVIESGICNQYSPKESWPLQKWLFWGQENPYDTVVKPLHWRGQWFLNHPIFNNFSLPPKQLNNKKTPAFRTASRTVASIWVAFAMSLQNAQTKKNELHSSILVGS